MKNFAITGVAGYIAPRHLNAIKETSNNLIAAIDPHDSVGILDSYFPQASFFTEIERFDRHLEKLRKSNQEDKLDYLTVCSPNHLHDAHIRLALRLGANVICEKPLVLNPWNLDLLEELEKESESNIYTVLQLRLHPSIIKLKKDIDSSDPAIKHNIDLSYITSRGLWYHYSWKAHQEKSGGIATNIGIHLFDLLIWIFGDVKECLVHYRNSNSMGGFIELERANVKWFLSIDKNHLPDKAIGNGYRTFRALVANGKEVEFSKGFTELHTEVYKETMKGRGFRINDARSSIELVYNVRNSPLSRNYDIIHPEVEKIIKKS
jgi:UDP-N-acetyl-2-amino-2-deoxyglucuronate dehydrogenase